MTHGSATLPLDSVDVTSGSLPGRTRPAAASPDPLVTMLAPRCSREALEDTVSFDDGFEGLLAGARRGEDRAWAALYDRYAPAVLGYLTAQRAPSPEDVTSEVFLQVVRDLDHFAGDEANFRSWLFTVAHHRLIDDRRKVSRRPADATEHDVIDRHLPPVEIEGQVIETVTTEELETLFDVLTPDQRAVLLLRVVGGLKLPEVADVLGKQHESVRALQKRALAALRRELAERPYPFTGEVALTPVR